MKRISAPLVLATLLVAGPAFAKGDVEAGKQKAAPCTACHSADGNASIDPQYPRIT